MSNQQNGIQPVNNEIEIWNNEKSDRIRKLFAPDLTNDEFAFFWGLGKGLQANPFTREIWAVKYDKNKPAQVFLGRDFYRKKAQEQKDYNGHIVDAVYENDDFHVKSGTPAHSYSLKDRGKLLGAYCVVHKKGIDNPFYVYVELEEYHKGQSTWKEKPATMIKKVAEAQALRGAYQGIFRGTYDESEQWDEVDGAPVQETENRQQIDTSKPKETVNEETGEVHGSDEPSLFDEVMDLGKQIHGKDWYKQSKVLADNISDGNAGNMKELDDTGLLQAKKILEAKVADFDNREIHNAG